MNIESNEIIDQDRKAPFFSGGVRELVRAPHRFFLQLTRDYGDVVQYRATPEQAFLLNHPDYVKHVLVSNGRNYNKETHLNKHMLQAVTGQGLLTSENPLWRKQRRLIQPFFHRSHLANFADLMVEATNETLARIDDAVSQNEPFDIANEMMTLTLNIVSRALFGYDIAEQSDRIGEAVNTLVEIGKPKRRRFQEMAKVLDDIVYGLIDRRLAQPHREQRDLLDMLTQARYEDSGERMEKRQVRDEVMSLLIAGHETTANTLSWLWYLLAQHPAIVAKIEAELDVVLHGRFPTTQDFAQLEYSNKVIKESMRLYPSAWSISRHALADDEIGGYHIPAGAIVALSPYTLHRHPAFWPEPETFDPERFTPEQEAARNRYAYIPFGAGARKCIGDQFALMESIIILPMILQKFRLQLVPDHPIEEHALVTLRPRHGILMTATRR
ncbi:MAG: cytochrome P450 [Ardenticatenaceae bacterium]|nr:cytochrome P450 [Anaerolineales bacterium]MCB9008322.1 cytochrome P450 [Ardenticatenaceae bacterium]